MQRMINRQRAKSELRGLYENPDVLRKKFEFHRLMMNN